MKLKVDFVSAEKNALKDERDMNVQFTDHLQGKTPKHGGYWFRMAERQLRLFANDLRSLDLKIWDLSGADAKGQRTEEREYRRRIREDWAEDRARKINERQPDIVAIADKLAGRCFREYVRPLLNNGQMFVLLLRQPGKEGHRSATEAAWQAGYAAATAEVQERLTQSLNSGGIEVWELVSQKNGPPFQLNRVP